MALAAEKMGAVFMDAPVSGGKKNSRGSRDAAVSVSPKSATQSVFVFPPFSPPWKVLRLFEGLRECKEAVAQFDLLCSYWLPAEGWAWARSGVIIVPFLRTGYSTHLLPLSSGMTASARGRLRRNFSCTLWRLWEAAAAVAWITTKKKRMKFPGPFLTTLCDSWCTKIQVNEVFQSTSSVDIESVLWPGFIWSPSEAHKKQRCKRRRRKRCFRFDEWMLSGNLRPSLSLSVFSLLFFLLGTEHRVLSAAVLTAV